MSRNLATMGVRGVASQRGRVGVGEHRIAIPDEVGEIDFLGYSPTEELLVVVECKATRVRTEPRFWKDELEDFVRRDPSYATKYRRKYEWVRANAEGLGRALASCGLEGEVSPRNLAGAMVTLYPSIASCFIDDFPCVSLSELMIGYGSQSHWPLDLGMIPLSA